MVYETKGKNDGLEDWSIYIRDEDAIHTSNFSVSILLEAINFIISLLRISFIKKKTACLRFSWLHHVTKNSRLCQFLNYIMTMTSHMTHNNSNNT